MKKAVSRNLASEEDPSAAATVLQRASPIRTPRTSSRRFRMTVQEVLPARVIITASLSFLRSCCCSPVKGHLQRDAECWWGGCVSLTKLRTQIPSDLSFVLNKQSSSTELVLVSEWEHPVIIHHLPEACERRRSITRGSWETRWVPFWPELAVVHSKAVVLQAKTTTPTADWSHPFSCITVVSEWGFGTRNYFSRCSIFEEAFAKPSRCHLLARGVTWL